MRRLDETEKGLFRGVGGLAGGCFGKRSLSETEEMCRFRVPRRPRAEGRLRNRVGRAPCSGSAVDVGFENLELFDQCIEFRRVCAEDAGGAHSVVVGFEAGKLVVFGDEPKAAVQAMIVVGLS